MNRLSNLIGVQIKDLAVMASPANESERTPAFVADGDRILDRGGRRWLTVEQAREKLPHLAFIASRAGEHWAEFEEARLLDLVRAIRGAERSDPPPAHSMARAA